MCDYIIIYDFISLKYFLFLIKILFVNFILIKMKNKKFSYYEIKENGNIF